VRISIGIIILVFCIGIPKVSSANVKNIKEHSMVCGDLLFKISRLSNSIKTHELSISWNAEDREKAKNRVQKEKLYRSTARHFREIESDYRTLASVVTIYKTITCSTSDLVHELYCPKGWSKECK